MNIHKASTHTTSVHVVHLTLLFKHYSHFIYGPPLYKESDTEDGQLFGLNNVQKCVQSPLAKVSSDLKQK